MTLRDNSGNRVEYPTRATCSAWVKGGVCHELATGVMRSKADGFIYEAACDDHGKDTTMQRFDRWGEVYGPAGPANSGGVDYRRDPSRPVVRYLP